MRVTALDGVKLRPQHLGLEAQCRHRSILLLTRSAALHHELERVLSVARGLPESRAEVLEAGGVDPRVVALERFPPHANRRRPEQLGKR